jgi:hypothetical protein
MSASPLWRTIQANAGKRIRPSAANHIVGNIRCQAAAITNVAVKIALLTRTEPQQSGCPVTVSPDCTHHFHARRIGVSSTA